MGKDKDVPRKKKTAKGPSSSAQAADLLSKRGGSNAFAKFKASAITQDFSSSSGEPILASFDAISDPVLKTNFKHLNKKDPTTRIKALTHIASNIADKPQDEIVRILPEWIMTLKKLVLDNTRRVREYSFIVFKEIAELVKKELGPYLKSIMGIWLISMHDHDREVAVAARNAFFAAFPDKEKQERALKFCEDEIVDQLITNFKQTVQTLTDSKSITKNEAEERYNRYISSSILALDYLIQNSNVENDKFKEICSNKNFWKYLTIKNFGQIRAATFKLVASISSTHPDLIEPNLGTISSLVLGCFNETDPVVHETMIESLITFMKHFPQAWNNVQPWKEIFPRLWTFLKNPENSSPSKTFQTLLPFVAMLDTTVMGGSNEKSFKFFDTFFASMWAGYTSERCQAHEKQIILNTYTEVCMYSLLQAKKYITGETEQKQQDSINLFISATFSNHFEKVVKYYLIEQEVPKEDLACKSIAVALAKFMSREAIAQPIRKLWTDLVPFTLDALNKGDVANTVSYRLYSLLKQIKTENADLVSLNYLTTFAADVFYESSNKALEQDSNVHLKVAYRIADVISLRQILPSASDSTITLDPAAFYHKYIVTLFRKYLSVEQNDKNRDFIESLYGLIGEFFNVFPEHFPEFDVIVDALINKPQLLFVLVQGVYTAQRNENEKIHNAKLDGISAVFAKESTSIFNLSSDSAIFSNFNTYLDLIGYLSVVQRVSSNETLHSILRDVSQALTDFSKLSPEVQSHYELYIIRFVNYLRDLLQTDVPVEAQLKLELLSQVFNLRIYDSNEVKYISDLFYETCIQIGAIKSSTINQEDIAEENMTYTTKPDDLPSEFINSQSATTTEEVLPSVTSSASLSGYESDSEPSDPSEYSDNEDEVEEVRTPLSETTPTETLVDDFALQNINALSAAASEAWKELYPVCITKQNAQEFVTRSVQHLKAKLTDAAALTISHTQLLMQADTVENIAAEHLSLPASTVWDALIFDREIWQTLRTSCEGVLRQIAIGNDIFLIPYTSDESKNTIASSIQLYGRFLSFALDKLVVYVRNTKIFTSDDISTLNNLWLVTEILHSFQSQLVVNESTASNIQDFITVELLPSLLSASGKISYGKELREKFVAVCSHLMSLVQKEENTSYYKDMKSFVMSTLSYLHQDYLEKEEEEKESGAAVGALRDLFSEVCSGLLFKDDLETLLNSKVASMNFTQVVESFFSAYLNQQTFDFVVTKLRAGIARQAREDPENSLYEKTITWISQCASILMQFTQEIANQSFDKEKGDKLMNLLRVQSSLAIFLNYLKDPEENIVSMHFVVSVTSEFTNTLLSSDFANDFIEQVDLIVSRLLFYVYRSTIDGALALDDQNDEFLVSFVEQHITRCTSLLSGGLFSFDDIATMVETLYYMVELSVSFVQSRISGGNVETVRRVYAQLLNVLNALAQFQLQLETNKKYQLLKIFQRVTDRLINDVSISIRSIPGDIFTSIDQSYEGDMKFSMSLLNILQTSTSIHALITAHDLLTRHQDTSYFVKKAEEATRNNLSNIIQPEEKLALLPTLVQLLKRPHREVKLAPIYEHLKWTNMHIFIERNEARNIHYRMLPYFLTWSIVAHLYDQGNDDQKAAIFSTLKDDQSYITLLNAIVSYVLTGASSHKYGLAMHEIIVEKDMTTNDASVAIAQDTRFLKSMADAVTHESIARLGAQVFFRLMKTFPSLIRQWYLNCVNDRSLKSLDKFLCNKLCPIVIDHEMEEILRNTKTSMPDHVKVKVQKKSGQILAIYQQDEVNLDITLNIPPNYPLKPLKVESSKRLGVSELQWRKWTLKMTSVLFTHEGKLWDSLSLWKQNLDKHFDGVEACPICYSIVHTHDHALPKIKCKTCRSKYHGACLYKWFNTSGNTTCPMCRSVFLP